MRHVRKLSLRRGRRMLSYRSETFRTDRRLEAILTKKKKRKKKKQLAVVEEEETAAAVKR